MMRSVTILVTLLPSALCTGCNPAKKIYSVKGTVVFEDGTSVKELAGGHVSFESVADHSNAAGSISESGQYQLTTPSGADGVSAGKYRVLIMPPEPADPDHPPHSILPDRYRSYERSDLEVTVEEKANVIDIKLRRN